MSRLLDVKIGSPGMLQAADRLERAAQRGRFVLAAADAVNAVTKRADEELRRGQLRNINLSPAYVKSKTDMTLAQPGGKARAEILTRGDLTTLGNFAPLSRIVAPGAQRRDGPIAGFRSAGTIVAITKSNLQRENQWFIMRLRRGNKPGDKFGVFVRDDSIAPKNDRGRGLGDAGRRRDGKAGKRHIYGPSPYALFKAQIQLQFVQIQDDLARTALTLMGNELRESI